MDRDKRKHIHTHTQVKSNTRAHIKKREADRQNASEKVQHLQQELKRQKEDNLY